MAVSASYGRKVDAAPVRLMLVDDSIVARSVVQAILAPLPEFTVAAAASSAEQALALLDRTPVDIVMLDLAMPGMDGLTALPEIVRRSRGARVLVVSASAGVGADACVRALTLGAADTLEKPRSSAFSTAFRDDLVDKLRRIAADIPSREPVAAVRAVPLPADPLRAVVAGPIACIAIGASTGGLHALSAFFRALPAGCTAPILITQHLPASFMPYFAAQITDIAHRPTSVARDGDLLRAGRVLVAPGDAHIRLQGAGRETRIALDYRSAPSACLPSVDPMLEAVAAQYGAQAFAVILTGMGRDGSIGARTLVEAGGEIAAQDRVSSVVWGMPGSVATAGLAATIADPARIAARIAERCGVRMPATGAMR
jgi:two-component system chemotaxis response regulator CheB